MLVVTPFSCHHALWYVHLVLNRYGNREHCDEKALVPCRSRVHFDLFPSPLFINQLHKYLWAEGRKWPVWFGSLPSFPSLPLSPLGLMCGWGHRGCRAERAGVQATSIISVLPIVTPERADLAKPRNLKYGTFTESKGNFKIMATRLVPVSRRERYEGVLLRTKFICEGVYGTVQIHAQD